MLQWVPTKKGVAYHLAGRGVFELSFAANRQIIETGKWTQVDLFPQFDRIFTRTLQRSDRLSELSVFRFSDGEKILDRKKRKSMPDFALWAWATGRTAGPVHSETFIHLTADAAAFTSDLPVIILDNFGAGDIPASSNLLSSLQLVSTVFIEPVNGTSRLTDAPVISSYAGIRRRVHSSTTTTAPPTFPASRCSISARAVRYWRNSSAVSVAGMVGSHSTTMPPTPTVISTDKRCDRRKVLLSAASVLFMVITRCARATPL